jgi:hypothetical protein
MLKPSKKEYQKSLFFGLSDSLDSRHPLYELANVRSYPPLLQKEELLSFWLKSIFLIWDAFPLSGILIRL